MNTRLLKYFQVEPWGITLIKLNGVKKLEPR